VAGLEKAFIKRVDSLDFFIFRAIFMRIAEAEPSGGEGGGLDGSVDDRGDRPFFSVLSSFLSPSVPSNFANGQVLSTNLDSNIVGAALFNLMAETSSERANTT